MDIQYSAFVILVGKPNSGKSYLLSYLLLPNHKEYSTEPFHYIICFTTTKFNRAWTEILPEEYVHPKYDADVLQFILDIQSQNTHIKAAIIFDDCLNDAAFKSQLFTNLVTTYRHYNLSVFISTQYLYKVTPTICECANRVALFRTKTDRSLRAAYESFGAYFKSY